MSPDRFCFLQTNLLCKISHIAIISPYLCVCLSGSVIVYTVTCISFRMFFFVFQVKAFTKLFVADLNEITDIQTKSEYFRKFGGVAECTLIRNDVGW